MIRHVSSGALLALGALGFVLLPVACGTTGIPDVPDDDASPGGGTGDGDSVGDGDSSGGDGDSGDGDSSGGASSGGSNAGSGGSSSSGGASNSGGTSSGGAMSTSCGDGVTDYDQGEQCDDGNLIETDICDSNCRVVNPVPADCGNNQLEAANNEQCDDGGNVAGDGCSPTCQFEPIGAKCGDGNQDPGEACDDGKHCSVGGKSCVSDMECAMGEHCLVRNGDGCNTTCNFSNQVQSFDIQANATTLAVDNKYLWMAYENNGGLERIDLSCSPTCMDGAPDTCSAPCTKTTILSGTIFYPVSDGTTLWFGANNGISAIDIAACDAALMGGAGDCDSLASVVAGGTAGHKDGTGAAAEMGDIRGLTYYDGLIYFADGTCGTLRTLDPSDNSVTTIVGPATLTRGSCSPTAMEGKGNAARLASPRYLASDNSGYIYVSDNKNGSIWRYDTRSTDLIRWAGTGSPGAIVDDVDGLSAQFDRPRDIISDGTSLFVADYNNHAIRQIDLETTETTTMAGDGNCGDTWGSGTGAKISKPMSLAYHFPSSSLFFYQNNFNCAAGTPQIMRIQ